MFSITCFVYGGDGNSFRWQLDSVPFALNRLPRFTTRALMALTAACAVGLAVERQLGRGFVLLVLVLGAFWSAGFVTARSTYEDTARSHAWYSQLVALNVLNWSLWYVNHVALRFMTEAHQQNWHFTHAAYWLVKANERYLFEAVALAVTCAVSFATWKESRSMTQVSALIGMTVWLMLMSLSYFTAAAWLAYPF